MPTKRIIAGLAAIVLVFSGCASSDQPPLHRPASTIQAWIVSETPLGSAVPQVRAVLVRHGWDAMLIDRDHPHGTIRSPGSRLVELQSGIGYYHVFLGGTEVRVSWLFADRRHLSEVRVTKPTTSL